MIEKTVIDYLNGVLPVAAYGEVPEKAPAEYVTVEKTGGGEQDKIKTATFAVQSHAQSLFEAASLSKLVCKKMAEAVSLKNISKVSINGDCNFTDTSKKGYRYQAVCDITYHE